MSHRIIYRAGCGSRLPWLWLSCTLSLMCLTAKAATNLTTLDWGNVGTVLSNSAAWDVVQVPAGVIVVTNFICDTKGVWLMGAGSGSNGTVLADQIPTHNNDQDSLVISLVKSLTNVSRISGFQLSYSGGANIVRGAITLEGYSPVEILNCTFNGLNKVGVMPLTTNWLIDNCTFITRFNSANGVHPQLAGASQIGSEAFAMTAIETTNMGCIEDCTFTNASNAGPITGFDSELGALVIMRNNLWLNDAIEGHGTESGGGHRGIRYLGIYNNTFIFTNPIAPWPNGARFRSGSGVVYSNSYSGYTAGTSLVFNRASHPFAVWSGADGTNGWDFNATNNFYATGTHTGTNSSSLFLTDSNANWTTNQWIAFSIQNNTKKLYGEVSDNTTTNAVIIADQFDGSQSIKFDNGDRYTIWFVTYGLDRPGAGLCTNFISGSFTPVVWPGQLTEGIYSWGNTLNGATEISPNSRLMVQNRDYFVSTPKAGYVALTYPHPLRSFVWPGSTNAPPPPPTIFSIGGRVVKVL